MCFNSEIKANWTEKDKQAYLAVIARQDEDHPEYKQKYLTNRQWCDERIGKKFNLAECVALWNNLLSGANYNPLLPLVQQVTPQRWAMEQRERRIQLECCEKAYIAFTKMKCKSLIAEGFDISKYIKSLTTVFDLEAILQPFGNAQELENAFLHWNNEFERNLKAISQ